MERAWTGSVTDNLILLHQVEILAMFFEASPADVSGKLREGAFFAVRGFRVWLVYSLSTDLRNKYARVIVQL